MLSAGRARDLSLKDEVLHLLVGPAVNRAERLVVCAVGRFVSLGDGDLVLVAVILDQLVCTESLMALFAVHERIGEGTEMSGSDPCLRVHKNRAVKTYIIRILLDKFLPPGFLDIVLKLNAQIAVVPGIRQTAVNFGAREDKSSGFCQCYNFIHCLFHVVRFLPILVIIFFIAQYS